MTKYKKTIREDYICIAIVYKIKIVIIKRRCNFLIGLPKLSFGNVLSVNEIHST